MSDPRIPEIYPRNTPSWQDYQRHSFWKLNDNERVPFNTDPAALEKTAKESLSINGRLYAHSNAGLSHTHLKNRQAFYNHSIIPKQLVDTNFRDTTTMLFGHKCSAPIGFAPIGINVIYHQKAELPVAKVAGELRLPYALSTAGSTSIEAVGRSNDEGAALPSAVKIENQRPEDANPIRFFQLYMPHDDELTISLLERAYKSGFTACILTTDTWQLGWRHDDIATSNYAFYRGTGAALGWTDPVFQQRMKEAGIDPKTRPEEAAAMWIDAIWHGRAWPWEKAEWVMEKWKKISGGMPFMIKGIQAVEDAWKCVEIGVDGIVVSNHAGRQVDGAIPSLDALEDIVRAGVGDKTVVTFDSGIRGASDVIKALCLGAKFVWIGRLWVWGLSIMGEEGVRHVMRSLLADLGITMAVGGFKSIDQMTPDRLKNHPRTYNLLEAKAHL